MNTSPNDCQGFTASGICSFVEPCSLMLLVWRLLCGAVDDNKLSTFSYYSAPDRGAEYCDERVCLSDCLSMCVCVFACPLSYLRNYTSDLHQSFYACYLWHWLGPALVAC